MEDEEVTVTASPDNSMEEWDKQVTKKMIDEGYSDQQYSVNRELVARIAGAIESLQDVRKELHDIYKQLHHPYYGQD